MHLLGVGGRLAHGAVGVLWVGGCLVVEGIDESFGWLVRLVSTALGWVWKGGRVGGWGVCTLLGSRGSAVCGGVSGDGRCWLACRVGWFRVCVV